MRTLLLSPSRNLASPRGWAITPTCLPEGSRYDEIHCVGGGTLLLWLLLKAGCAPRATRVVCHGHMVLPTPESCAAWLGEDARVDVDDYEWRREAIKLGIGGALRDSGKAWLEPLLLCIASGRAHELESDFRSLQMRWERSGARQRLARCPTAK